MGYMNIKMKLMPSSIEADLEKIKKFAEKKVVDEGGKGVNFEIEPIAFGLNAVNVMFIWPEEKELEAIESGLGEIENVNSAELVDIRRAIG